MDKYEFCTPNFVVGNCLLLDSSIHQYDRVYCGASCPAEHENYMKNLVRVGGILVMPLNDHLLQVTRTGETTYEVKNVLPVSFASLVVPSSNEALTSVKLPETYPLSLQEICRSAIRVLLRRNVEMENPTLKDKKKPPHPKRKRGRRRMKRIVIPIFEEMRNNDGRRGSRSDLEDSRRGSQSDAEPGRGDSGRGSQNDVDDGGRAVHHPPPVVTRQNGKIVFNLDYDCGERESTEQKMEVADEDDAFVEESFPEYNEKVGAERSERGGVHPTTDSGIDNISDDSVADDSEKTGSSNPSSSQEPEEGGATRNPLYLKRSAEDDDDEDDPGTNARESQKYPNYRSTAVIFKRVAFSDVESDEFDDSDSGRDCFPPKEESEEKSDLSGYTCLMRQKIARLPLPHALKVFLNFSRPV
ncbi:uncharacterized protein LOC129220397 [Uloborus diversus]|uniref:uncharacterized protein LOC129220397 n=1 Tax=Uloborus diversus TaxID=327109 RepID=UPI002409B3FE|nr:uncharacterized protein LOC129220397 [Uloborus diversus]